MTRHLFPFSFRARYEKWNSARTINQRAGFFRLNTEKDSIFAYRESNFREILFACHRSHALRKDKWGAHFFGLDSIRFCMPNLLRKMFLPSFRCLMRVNTVEARFCFFPTQWVLFIQCVRSSLGLGSQKKFSNVHKSEVSEKSFKWMKKNGVKFFCRKDGFSLW